MTSHISELIQAGSDASANFFITSISYKDSSGKDVVLPNVDVRLKGFTPPKRSLATTEQKILADTFTIPVSRLTMDKKLPLVFTLDIGYRYLQYFKQWMATTVTNPSYSGRLKVTGQSPNEVAYKGNPKDEANYTWDYTGVRCVDVSEPAFKTGEWSLIDISVLLIFEHCVDSLQRPDTPLPPIPAPTPPPIPQ